MRATPATAGVVAIGLWMALGLLFSGCATRTPESLFRRTARQHGEQACFLRGLPAGEIANHLAIPANTLSSHLGVLTRAGLIRSERRSRSIIYRVDLDRLRDLVLFLLKDCCGGRADLCEPLLAELAPCCP